ncbi:transcription factor E4F1-like [Lethenteron reissneri]|uniref:transcription factor E4F1-like n=1 Tax=Lethenteron reissneri TaxID=7753 RepID=UPI002AB65AE3|nr:transcription factor E4F1-like [Lethenteron reissneri]
MSDAAAAFDGGGGALHEEDDDVHKCGRCQEEFNSLEAFIQHRLQQACSRAPAGAPLLQPSANEGSVAPPASGDVDVDGAGDIVAVPRATRRRARASPPGDLRPPDSGAATAPPGLGPAPLGSLASPGPRLAARDGAPFVCSLCPKQFKTAVILKAHMVTHSSSKQFRCTVCATQFHTKGSLVRHARRHTGERPYVCKECGQGFRESGALSRHLKSLTPCTDRAVYTGAQARAACRPAHTAAQAEKAAEMPESGATGTDAAVGSAGDVASAGDTESAGAVASTGAVGSAGDTYVLLITPVAHGEKGDSGCGDDKEGSSSIGQGGSAAADATIGQHRPEEPNLIGRAMKNSGIQEARAAPSLPGSARPIETEDLAGNEGAGPREGAEPEEGAELAPEARPMETQTPADVVGSAEEEVRQREEESGDLNSGGGGDGAGRLPRHTEPCPYCHKRFRGHRYLQMHIHGHRAAQRAEASPNVCTVCGKSFVTVSVLRKHLAAHGGERRYRCGECGKLYKCVAHVRDHMRAHSESRPFPCAACGKNFKTKHALQVHERTHGQVKPHACPDCPARFRERASLVRHRRQHTGERPFPCPRCSRSFAEHGTLNRHLRAKGGCSLGPSAPPHGAPCRAPPLPLGPPTEATEATEGGDPLLGEDPTAVLVEFSSVVADTQEYIIHAGQAEEREHSPSFMQRMEVPAELVQMVQHIVRESRGSGGHHRFILHNVGVGEAADAGGEPGPPPPPHGPAPNDDPDDPHNTEVAMARDGAGTPPVVSGDGGGTIILVTVQNETGAEEQQAIAMTMDGTGLEQVAAVTDRTIEETVGVAKQQVISVVTADRTEVGEECVAMVTDSIGEEWTVSVAKDAVGVATVSIGGEEPASPR